MHTHIGPKIALANMIATLTEAVVRVCFEDEVATMLQVMLLMLRTALYLPAHKLDHTRYITNHDKHDVSPTSATVSNNITTLQRICIQTHIRMGVNASPVDSRGNGRVS